MSWLCPSFCRRQAGSYELGSFQGIQGIQYTPQKPPPVPVAKPANGALSIPPESGIVPDIKPQYNTQSISKSTTQNNVSTTKKDKAPSLPPPPLFTVPPPPTTPLPSDPVRADVKKHVAPQPPQTQQIAVVVEEVKIREKTTETAPQPPQTQQIAVVVEEVKIRETTTVTAPQPPQIQPQITKIESPRPPSDYEQITEISVIKPIVEPIEKQPTVKFIENRPPAPTPTPAPVDQIRNSTELSTTSSEDIYSTSNEPTPEPDSTIDGGDRLSTNPGTKTNLILNQPTATAEHRRSGIVPERIEEHTINEIQTYEKDEKSKELIKLAISKNDFLNNMMDTNRLEAVTMAMYPKHYEPSELIIVEGETGSHVYVSADGKFDVIKNNLVISNFGVGVAFGELAILYRAKRFASIRATTPAKVWILDRKVFQRIMLKTGRLEREENLNFLRSVTALKDLSEEKLIQVAGLLKREFHAANSAIITQGAEGDKFFIIRAGTVNIVKRDSQGQERLVNSLKRGDYFGEQALLHRDKRLATVLAEAPGTECLTLDRTAFEKYLGTLDQIKSIVPTDKFQIEKPKPPQVIVINEKYAHIKLKELEIVGTLGVGGFGRVELVRYKKTNETFALKYLKKVEMVKQQHQQHVYSEKDIMASCDSPFIIKLFNTYRDTKYLYFLMEACLGGDVWTVLQNNKHFDEGVGRFMTACVIEALEYMHTRNMVYRDLKPENLMLDQKGYVKLVDFGFAKRVGPTQHTWTFAGTPEYVAPEIILNKGHDRAVDYWALGVLVHELLVGKPPFRGKDHMKTYSLILRGIDVIQMPTRIPRKVQDLIKKLCRQIPTERLGYARNGISDIKSHTWFHGLDWDKVHNQAMVAPLIRKVRNNTDLSNFEAYPRDEDDPPDETSGWDLYF